MLVFISGFFFFQIMLASSPLCRELEHKINKGESQMNGKNFHENWRTIEIKEILAGDYDTP